MIGPDIQADNSKLTGGAGGNAGPATATSGPASFDNSGWTVSTGSSKAASGAKIPPWVYLAGGGLLLVGVILWKKLG